MERVAAHLLAHGRVARGHLGVSLQPVRVEGREAPGAVLVGLEADGPARRAGLLQGDILLSVAGEPPAGLRHRLGPETVGTEVEAVAYAGGDDEIRALRAIERDLKAAVRAGALRLTVGEPSVAVTLKPAEA